MNTVQVYLVDDEADVTDALVWLLESVSIRSRAFTSAQAFLAEVRRAQGPACAVLDLRMPEMSGLELQRQLIAHGHDDIPLVFLTAHGDVPAAVNAMQAGAIDFVQKPFNPDSFLESIRRAMRLALQRHTQRSSEVHMRRLLAHLSSREIEVLRGLLDGLTSKELGKVLGISPKTVDVHRANVVRKMQVGSTTELVRMLGRDLPLPPSGAPVWQQER
ncbi:response regulator transcription factor [Pusillimonas sp. CC-YST705]|uniref:Response regulator transcription factor n=1 Tax=Mesopusillimonas faecipullorum TaxID=2755040 RepID=A0ABS8C8S5_9BURK|nr:response regulator [Mesopusillimonas faecipullorum]MCB5362426.1 response regulator transcription factor [Mesopusillimonas faecipullorum]